MGRGAHTMRQGIGFRESEEDVAFRFKEQQLSHQEW
jgi:hypothetical protein